jgi:hypothetical protein
LAFFVGKRLKRLKNRARSTAGDNRIRITTIEENEQEKERKTSDRGEHQVAASLLSLLQLGSFSIFIDAL